MMISLNELQLVLCELNCIMLCAMQKQLLQCISYMQLVILNLFIEVTITPGQK